MKKGWTSSLFSAFVFILLIVYTAVGTIESFNDISKIQSQTINNTEDNLSIDNTDHFSLNFSHNPFQMPGDSNPYAEDEDEKDNLDDDEWYKSHSFYTSTFKTEFDEISSEHSVRQFEQSVANSTKISLFVLHHSWKDFPDLIL